MDSKILQLGQSHTQHREVLLATLRNFVLSLRFTRKGHQLLSGLSFVGLWNKKKIAVRVVIPKQGVALCCGVVLTDAEHTTTKTHTRQHAKPTHAAVPGPLPLLHERKARVSLVPQIFYVGPMHEYTKSRRKA
eukprot:Phypoly_transcript_11244.p1 GENE.Phypoly_transcript_11244~~Phypoly_transcript_11244.p1  ORF type:complete len:133 (-),score=17.11 Phypoly_transcript_11244:184-582(-)